jgi:integrase
MEIQKRQYSDGWHWTLRVRVNHAEHGEMKSSYRRLKLAPVGNLRQQNAPQDVKQIAKEKMEEILPNNKDIKPETIVKLGDFVERVYLPWCEKHKRRSTYYNYKNQWHLYFKPRCSDWWMRESGTPELVALLNTVLAEHDLSATTMHHLKAFLSGVFTYAIAMGYYKGVHPLNMKQGGIRIAFPTAREGAGDDDLHAYTQEEINEILALVPEPGATAVAVAAYTGLRRGEIAGLVWENLHLAVNGAMASIFVGRSIWNGAASDPKTKESKAPVPLIKPLAERLEMHRMLSGNAMAGPIFRQPAQQVVNGVAWHPLDFDNLTQRVIVPSLESCKNCGKRRIEHDDKKLKHSFGLDENRILWHGWHGFRRGLATNLYRMGVPDKTIQKILRHRNLKTTTDIYLRPNQSDKEAGMKTLESQVVLHPRCTPKCTKSAAPGCVTC